MKGRLTELVNKKKQRFNEINNGNEMQLNELVQFVALQYIFWIPEVAVNN